MKPFEIYSNPENFLEFLKVKCDNDFEGQFYDRKEIPNSENNTVSSSQVSSIRDQITECISAFTNSNQDGGLLVLGISSNGEINGTGHLTEKQYNQLTNFGQVLKGHSAISKIHRIKLEEKEKEIILIYAPYNSREICETIGTKPIAWQRHGKQNIVINDLDRDRIKREKHIVDYERTICCSFNEIDIDMQVLEEFKKNYLTDSIYNYNTTDLLKSIGALEEEKGLLYFNNAGYLFFGKNPQSKLAWAYVRLLRFDSHIEDETSYRRQSLEKKFDGNLPQQIRKVRGYFRESGFFKMFQKRNDRGGFTDDPEYPAIATDESIVNAVVHRDYGIQLPIECKSYRNAFVVENAGRILQRSVDLPQKFTLDEFNLNHMPRNAKLLEWLKVMRDENGAEFVRALSEGTKKIRDEMKVNSLPSPDIDSSPMITRITLRNNIEARERESIDLLENQNKTEFINLFEIIFSSSEGKEKVFKSVFENRKELKVIIQNALQNSGWYIDRSGFGTITCHMQGASLNINGDTSSYLKFFPAYTFQIKEYYQKIFIAIDYSLVVKNVLNLARTMKFIDPNSMLNKKAIAKQELWYESRIVKVGENDSSIMIKDLGKTFVVNNNSIIPELNIKEMSLILRKNNVAFELNDEIKKHSLLIDKRATQKRIEFSKQVVGDLQEKVFPIKFKDIYIRLNNKPVYFSHKIEHDNFTLQSINEPKVEFRKHYESSDIRDGITKYGTYDDLKKTIEIIPICLAEYKNSMRDLLNRLQIGKYKYHGSEKTFSIKLTYPSIIMVSKTIEIIDECKRLVTENRDWIGNSNLSRIFFIHIPESEYALDDEKSPYYVVKRFLLENGIPSQMVDTPTLISPDWKDLNITLNIAAKCGIKPWVLPDRIPDADFFIGLSYTQSNKGILSRFLGYATVFNQFGRWEFYSGNTNAFNYSEKGKYFYKLTKQTLERLTLSETPNIYFHYSAKFSREDKEAILKAAREIRPKGIYHFVSINMNHNLRLYDQSIETDGSLGRGFYVITSPNQIILSTTGYNPYRKNMGTPKPIEITLRSYSTSGIEYKGYDLKSLAVQVLSLTKLNWASSESISSEPITTKYAGDIAYLTHAFLRSGQEFKLHPVLESTTWFI